MGITMPDPGGDLIGESSTPRQVHYLSQVNFVPYGALRDVVIYPQSLREMRGAGRTDQEVHTCLKWAHVSPRIVVDGRAQLEFLEGGEVVRPDLDDVRNWPRNLSPGQQQRLAF